MTFASKLKALKKQGKDKYPWGVRKVSKCSSSDTLEFKPIWNWGGNNIVMQLELNLNLVELNSNTLNGIWNPIQQLN